MIGLLVFVAHLIFQIYHQQMLLILRKIRNLELDIDETLISNKELFVIQEEWDNALLLEEMTSHTIERLKSQLIVKQRLANE
jgi:hypothetical protein